MLFPECCFYSLYKVIIVKHLASVNNRKNISELIQLKLLSIETFCTIYLFIKGLRKRFRMDFFYVHIYIAVVIIMVSQ